MRQTRIRSRVKWAAKQVRNKDVLDVGSCDFSWMPKQAKWMHAVIKRNAKSVVGIDIFKEGIKIARQLGYNDIIYANAENFSLGKKFDVVFAGELIEHLGNPGLFLSCAKKHLRKNGKLVLTTPNARHPMFWISEKKHSPCHVQLYTMQILKQLLQQSGFDVVTESYFGGNPRTLKGKLYENIFLSLFPEFTMTIGVVAKVRK